MRDLRGASFTRERGERDARIGYRVRNRTGLAAREQKRAALAHDQRDEDQHCDHDDREQRAD